MQVFSYPENLANRGFCNLRELYFPLGEQEDGAEWRGVARSLVHFWSWVARSDAEWRGYLLFPLGFVLGVCCIDVKHLSLFVILQMRSRFSRDHSSSRRSNMLTEVGCGATEVLCGAQIR